VAEDILSQYQHVIKTFTFVTGSKGVFDVKVNDRLIFSKKERGRHAEPGEVLALFRELVGPDMPTYPQTEH
jgi:selenoprotein W-related protein